MSTCQLVRTGNAIHAANLIESAADNHTNFADWKRIAPSSQPKDLVWFDSEIAESYGTSMMELVNRTAVLISLASDLGSSLSKNYRLDFWQTESRPSATFHELDKVRSDEARFRIALNGLRANGLITARDAVVSRIEALLEDFQADYGRCLDSESLRVFSTLLSQYPHLKKPLITATPNGNLCAEWKSDDKSRYLALQMLPTHQVAFVATMPDKRHPHQRKTISGSTAVEDLFSDLNSYEILSWACAS